MSSARMTMMFGRFSADGVFAAVRVETRPASNTIKRRKMRFMAEEG
jgi:hypothetical protein